MRQYSRFMSRVRVREAGCVRLELTAWQVSRMLRWARVMGPSVRVLYGSPRCIDDGWRGVEGCRVDVLKASASSGARMRDPAGSMLECGDGGLGVMVFSGPTVSVSGWLRGPLVLSGASDSMRESMRRPFPSQSIFGGGRPLYNKKKNK